MSAVLSQIASDIKKEKRYRMKFGKRDANPNKNSVLKGEMNGSVPRRHMHHL